MHLLATIAEAFVETPGVEAVSWAGQRRCKEVTLCRTMICMSTRAPQCRWKFVKRLFPAAPTATSSITHSGSWKMTGLNQTARSSTSYRSCQEAEDEIERRLRRHMASLGYTTAWCFSISHSQILADPNGWLANVQRQTRGPYPNALVQAILRKNRPVLGGGMQSCYLKQIRTAVVRVDPVSLNHRVAAWLASYFDILFAINGRFHPGEKRLLIYAEELPILPERALSDVGDLCALAGKLGARDHRSPRTNVGTAG